MTMYDPHTSMVQEEVEPAAAAEEAQLSTNIYETFSQFCAMYLEVYSLFTAHMEQYMCFRPLTASNPSDHILGVLGRPKRAD